MLNMSRKPFLGIDITENSKNSQPNGMEVLTAKPSAALSAALDTSSEHVVNMVEDAKLSLMIRILHWICGAVGGIILIGILKAMTGSDRVSLTEAYQNAAWLFWLGGGCLAVWMILKLVGGRKAQRVMESDESQYLISNWNRITDAVFAELDVPPDAQVVDLLSFTYKTKNDMPAARTRGMDITPYQNKEFQIFADQEQIHFVNLDGKYSFPRSALRTIRRISKGIWIPDWNKDIAPNEEPYKQFKLSTNNYGHLHVKPYYVLELDHLGEEWGIYFPNYELTKMEALTGLQTE